MAAPYTKSKWSDLAELSPADAREHAELVVRSESVGRADIVAAYAPTQATNIAVQASGEFFEPILSDIESAESSIHILMFGFRAGKVGDRFAEALAAKARSGVSVRLIVDRQGSKPRGAEAEFYGRLVDAGAHIVVNDPFGLFRRKGLLTEEQSKTLSLDQALHIDHRKLYVVDGKAAWLGGAGIEDHFADGRFDDVMVRLEGPVLAHLQHVFLTSFRWLGGALPLESEEFDRWFLKVDAPGLRSAAQIQNQNPGERFLPVTDAIASAFERAASSLDVLNPYLADAAMIQRLISAARRGVRVRVLIPGKPNNWIAASGTRHHYPQMLEAGIEIYEYPSMLHAKVFVQDEAAALVGTCNLDAWALYRDFELQVELRDADVASQIRTEVVEPAIEVSRPAKADRDLLPRLRNFACSIAAPLM